MISYTIKQVVYLVPNRSVHLLCNSLCTSSWVTRSLHSCLGFKQNSVIRSTDGICMPYLSSLTISRNYAKGKDKKKEKGKNVKTKVEVNEQQLSELLNIDAMRKQMQRSVEHLKDDFVKHLSLRSSAGSIESISVTLDGKEHTLQELAQIVRTNPKTVVLNMSVFPQAIPAALKAIEKSGMNLNPQQDGTTLYIPIPKVTKEHRENLSKNAKSLFIKCKDSIRDIQLKQTKSLKKKSGLSEDLLRNVEQQLVAVADGYISEAEKILDNKQNELVN